MGAAVRSRLNRECVDYIVPLLEKCVDSERVRGLSERSLTELRRAFVLFRAFLETSEITSIHDITPETLKQFLYFANPTNRPAQGKTYVWSIRKFFAFLTLRQIITDNPARAIPHPKERPREKLPLYLKPAELSALLETAAEKRSLQDFTILSLLATAGPRPHEIASLRLQDVVPDQQYIFLHVKGGWYKRSPISAPMAETLREYIDTCAPPGPPLFLNKWGRPIDRRWIERMLRDAAKEAGIKYHVTPNILRHTFATYAADRHGITITRALLGHCNRSHSTEIYMHLIPSKFRALMNAHPYQTTVRTAKRNR